VAVIVEIATAYPPLNKRPLICLNNLDVVHSPPQFASASNKTQTDQQSVALIIVVPSEGDRLLEWISTPPA